MYIYIYLYICVVDYVLSQFRPLCLSTLSLRLPPRHERKQNENIYMKTFRLLRSNVNCEPQIRKNHKTNLL